MPKGILYPEEVTIRVTLAKNGVIMSGYKKSDDKDEPGEEMSYVYKTIKEAAGEMEAFANVLMGDKDKMPKDDKELDDMEEEANKAAKMEA